MDANSPELSANPLSTPIEVQKGATTRAAAIAGSTILLSISWCSKSIIASANRSDAAVATTQKLEPEPKFQIYGEEKRGGCDFPQQHAYRNSSVTVFAASSL